MIAERLSQKKKTFVTVQKAKMGKIRKRWEDYRYVSTFLTVLFQF